MSVICTVGKVCPKVVWETENLTMILYQSMSQVFESSLKAVSCHSAQVSASKTTPPHTSATGQATDRLDAVFLSFHDTTIQ